MRLLLKLGRFTSFTLCGWENHTAQPWLKEVLANYSEAPVKSICNNNGPVIAFVLSSSQSCPQIWTSHKLRCTVKIFCCCFFMILLNEYCFWHDLFSLYLHISLWLLSCSYFRCTYSGAKKTWVAMSIFFSLIRAHTWSWKHITSCNCSGSQINIAFILQCLILYTLSHCL